MLDDSTYRTLKAQLNVLNLYLNSIQRTQEKTYQEFKETHERMANCTKDMQDSIKDLERELEKIKNENTMEGF